MFLCLIGLTAKEKTFLERIKLGDNSNAASLVSCDSSAFDSAAACLPPGLFGLFNTESEAGGDPHRRNLTCHPHQQYSHDGRISYSRYSDQHNSRWDQHSNIATTLVPYYGYYRSCRNGASSSSPRDDVSHTCGTTPSCCQCNSTRVSYGRHRQRYHRFQEGDRLCGNPEKQDFGGLDYIDNTDHQNGGSLPPGSAALDHGSDPLDLLSALTLLNSVEHGGWLGPTDGFQGDSTAPLIAEILEQLSQTTDVDSTMKEKPEETASPKLSTSCST